MTPTLTLRDLILAISFSAAFFFFLALAAAGLFAFVFILAVAIVASSSNQEYLLVSQEVRNSDGIQVVFLPSGNCPLKLVCHFFANELYLS